MTVRDVSDGTRAQNIDEMRGDRKMRGTIGGRLTYSVEESAEILGIGTTLAKELIRTGELPSIKIGRRRLVAWADLESFVDRCREVA